MSEQKQVFILSFLGLIFGSLLLLTILSNNILRERNLKLNEFAIYNCKVVRSETTTKYQRP